MNDVREAIERVGERFDPPGGFDDLSRRRGRRRGRRRLAATAVAVAVPVAGSIVLVQAHPGPAPGRHPKPQILATWSTTAAVTPTATATKLVSCPTPNGDSPSPVLLSATSGPAGSSVDVSVTFWSALLWMQLWWNAGEMTASPPPPPWPPTGPDLSFDPAGPGPVVKLVAEAGPETTGNCLVHTSFTVPAVEPGTYQLRWLFGNLGRSTAPSVTNVYALLASELTFRVTG